jgi:hypothetical protein
MAQVDSMLPPAASMGQKLDNTLKLWREQNITIQDFIKAWVCDRQAGGSGYSAARRVNGPKRALQQPDVARILSRETVPEVSGVGTLQDELDALVGRPLFHRYNAEASVGDLDNLTFEGAHNEIVRWHHNGQISLINYCRTPGLHGRAIVHQRRHHMMALCTSLRLLSKNSLRNSGDMSCSGPSNM